MRAPLAALAFVVACTSATEPPPAPTALRGEEVAATLDLYFQAYRGPVLAGTGNPDPALWQQAVARGGPRYTRLVHDALDIALGFDFVHPPALDPTFCARPAEADDRAGVIRAVADPVAATALLDAVAAAVHEAVAASDPSLVTPRMMRSFWSSRFGSYHPMHTGRCYPHGHAEYTEPFWDCVDNSLEGLVHRFLEDLQGRTAPTPLTLDDEDLGGCNCYVNADCDSTLFVCGDYGGCTRSGKLDGKCTKKTAALEELGW